MRGQREVSLQIVLSTSAEHGHGANSVRRSQGPLREALEPRQSAFRQELLPKSELQRVPKQSDRKAGSHRTPNADSLKSGLERALNIPNGCEQICHDCDNVNEPRRNANVAPTQRRDGGTHGPDDGHAPTPRTTRTTSSQGSSGWEFGETCSFPAVNVVFGSAGEGYANTPLDSTRWMHTHAGCINHKFFTIRQSFHTASTLDNVSPQDLQPTTSEII